MGEYGLLSGFEGVSTYPEATLTTNEPAGFQVPNGFISKLKTRENVFLQIKIPAGKSREDAYCPWRRQIAVPKEKEKEMLSKLN